MKNNLKSIFKSESYQYFEYAMLAFAGLGLEVLYAFWLEPLIYGHSMKEFTTAECIIHWTVTILTWLLVAYLIVKSAKRNLGFQLKGTDSKWTLVGIIASCILIGLMLVINYIDVGGLKIIHEFHKLGILKFIFQHLFQKLKKIHFLIYQMVGPDMF